MTRAGSRLQIHALQSTHAGPFSLEVAGGECVAIVRASGAGKSVFLRMIADLDPHRGEVRLDGRLCKSWPAPQWRRMVVYQAAEPAWWESTVDAHFSALERQAVLHMLPRFGLYGERQRLTLLRSLACDPRTLLLDAPASALDRASTAIVCAWIV